MDTYKTMMEDVSPFEFDDVTDYDEYHDVVTITIAELCNDGIFDLSRSDWDFGPKYSPEQHKVLCDKITAHYWTREIALTPVRIWKHEFLRKMNEIMPKYMSWYKAVDEGMMLGTSSEYGKSRNIYSDFPQTALQGETQDYASTGNDVEFERIKQVDPLELAERIQSYNDVDLAIIKEIEPLFSCLFTVNINGF